MKEKMKHSMEKERSSIVGFAVAGLAIGVAAWYLFGTKEGRENFDRAIEGIGEVSSKLQKKAKETLHEAGDKIKEGVQHASEFKDELMTKASKLGEKAQDKFEDATAEAKEKGSKMAQDAKDLANKAAHSATDVKEKVEAEARKHTL